MLQQDYRRIVTVGSWGAVQTLGQLASHCAAKAGVVALTQAIADETKDTNITANIVLPRVIDTLTNRQRMGERERQSVGATLIFGSGDLFLSFRSSARCSRCSSSCVWQYLIDERKHLTGNNGHQISHWSTSL